MADTSETAKKGDAAPLEGIVGKEVMFMLNVAFLGIGLGMLQSLGHSVSARLAATPKLGAPAAPTAAAAPKMSLFHL